MRNHFHTLFFILPYYRLSMIFTKESCARVKASSPPNFFFWEAFISNAAKPAKSARCGSKDKYP